MSEQLNLELDALRTENTNLKTALHTAERMLGNMQLGCTTQHSTQQESEVSYIGIMHADSDEIHWIKPPRQPYGIHGNKFPGVSWPDPKKMQFDIVRDYDPMHMGNRDKALHLSAYRESPRRRRSDLREAED